MFLEVLVLLLLALFIYDWWAKGYWTRRGVFTVGGEFFFGHTRKFIMLQSDITEYLDNLYKKHKEKKLIGLYNFWEPFLVITDLDYVRSVLVSDFNSFADPVVHLNGKSDPLFEVNPFASSGEEWKKRRALHVSMLTSAKLKENVSLMMKTGQEMINFLNEKKSQPITVTHLAKLYTIDNISSIAYGYEPSAFRDPENGFRKHASELTDSNVAFSSIANLFIPYIYDLFRLRIFSKHTSDFFIEMAKELFNFRRQNSGTRNDLVDQLLKMDDKLKSEGNQGIQPMEFAGHLMTVYVDSVETSSNLLSFLLLELANRPEVQGKLREEISAAGNDMKDFDFEKVQSLVFLDKIFNEILRLHPLLRFYTRLCTKDTTLGDLRIEKGTKILIPYNSIVNDPDLYPEPNKFDPERYASENMGNAMRKSFFPFGDGPRQCLGRKYATLQIKLAVIYILLKFTMSPGKKMEGSKVSSTSTDITQKPHEEEKIIFLPL